MEDAKRYFLIGDDAEAAAKEKGCVVVYPEHNQLQLDLDSEEAYKYFQQRIDEAREFLGWVCCTKVSYSSSGRPNRHVTITVRGANFGTWERIALQNMFGSDPVREGMNALRYAYGNKTPSRLFEPEED